MGAEVNILQSVKRLHGAVDMAAPALIIKESTGHRPLQPNFQKCPHYLTSNATLCIKNSLQISELLSAAAKLSVN